MIQVVLYCPFQLDLELLVLLGDEFIFSLKSFFHCLLCSHLHFKIICPSVCVFFKLFQYFFMFNLCFNFILGLLKLSLNVLQLHLQTESLSVFVIKTLCNIKHVLSQVTDRLKLASLLPKLVKHLVLLINRLLEHLNLVGHLRNLYCNLVRCLLHYFIDVHDCSD